MEHFIITGNTITNLVGQLLTFFKSGNDESIMGMSLLFANNKISNSNAEENNAPFISLTGVQKSIIENNTFSNCHESKMIIEYKDFVGARHIFHTNFSKKSDTIDANKYEIAKENRFE